MELLVKEAWRALSAHRTLGLLAVLKIGRKNLLRSHWHAEEVTTRLSFGLGLSLSIVSIH